MQSARYAPTRNRSTAQRLRGRLGAAALCLALAAAGTAAATPVSASTATQPSAAASSDAPPGAGADLTKLVNPFIGTENEGLTFLPRARRSAWFSRVR